MLLGQCQVYTCGIWVQGSCVDGEGGVPCRIWNWGGCIDEVGGPLQDMELGQLHRWCGGPPQDMELGQLHRWGGVPLQDMELGSCTGPGSPAPPPPSSQQPSTPLLDKHKAVSTPQLLFLAFVSVASLAELPARSPRR